MQVVFEGLPGVYGGGLELHSPEDPSHGMCDELGAGCLPVMLFTSHFHHLAALLLEELHTFRAFLAGSLQHIHLDFMPTIFTMLQPPFAYMQSRACWLIVLSHSVICPEHTASNSDRSPPSQRAAHAQARSYGLVISEAEQILLTFDVTTTSNILQSSCALMTADLAGLSWCNSSLSAVTAI